MTEIRPTCRLTHSNDEFAADMHEHVSARMCRWGCSCRFGTGCFAWHSSSDQEHFVKKEKLRELEWEQPCVFCVQGCCREGVSCQRGIGGRRSWRATEPEVEEWFESEEGGDEEWGDEVVSGMVGVRNMEGMVQGGGRFEVLGEEGNEGVEIIDSAELDFGAFIARARKEGSGRGKGSQRKTKVKSGRQDTRGGSEKTLEQSKMIGATVE